PTALRTRLRVDAQTQGPALDVLESGRVVPEREVADVVVERVDGEIAPPDVLVDRAVDVVAQDAARLVVQAVVVAAVRAGRAKRGDLDDIASEADMREA